MLQANPGRIIGHALFVGPAADSDDARRLAEMGLAVQFVVDPYLAMLELADQPDRFSTVVLSLVNLFPEELTLAAVIRRRFPHIHVMFTEQEQRPALATELARMGVERLDHPPAASMETNDMPLDDDELENDPVRPLSLANAEPVLTAEELRALLDEQPLPLKQSE